MAEKTVATKLLVKPGSSLWLSDSAFRGLLGPMPEGVTDAPEMSRAGVAIVIAESAAGVRSLADSLGAELSGPPILWFLYRKGNRADVNRDSLWRLLADYGIRPITQVAIDDEWSALRFRPLKPGE
ncbi:MAG: hypothetical protein ACXWNR_03435 [Candidatus Limnocylindrales bacterium]